LNHFFFFLGLFHLDRIWVFICPKEYNNFWLDILQSRNTFFYILETTLVIFSLVLIVYFIKYFKEKKWWKWIYLFGGTYVFFDSISNLLNSNLTRRFVINMYTLEQPYYNILWGFFVVLGIICIVIGRYLWNYSEDGEKT